MQPVVEGNERCLDELSWEEISEMAHRNELKRGDTKRIELTDGTTCTAKVIAIKGDKFSGVVLTHPIFAIDCVITPRNKEPTGYLPSDLRQQIIYQHIKA